MKFCQAFELMKQGLNVKLPEWAGYWSFERFKETTNQNQQFDNIMEDFDDKLKIKRYLKSGTILMHCKDGKVLDIRQTEDIGYTLEFIMRDEWEVADETNSKLVQGELVVTFGFGEAIRRLKNGKTVARKDWNGANQYLYHVKSNELSTGLKYGYGEYEGEPQFTDTTILETTGDKLIIGWTPTSTDMYATDWFEVGKK